MSNELSHFDKDGKAVMVDISEKNETERTAVATGEIRMNLTLLYLARASMSE